MRLNAIASIFITKSAIYFEPAHEKKNTNKQIVPQIIYRELNSKCVTVKICTYLSLYLFFSIIILYFILSPFLPFFSTVCVDFSFHMKNRHIPKAKATAIADTPELKRIAENTKIQSNVKYHADFEKQKGKLTQVCI